MNSYMVIGIAVIAVILILRFFVCKFFYRCKLLNDILQEQGQDKIYRYSQGRIYLLLSIICYYITLGIMTSKGLKPNISIDTKTLDIIIEALQWSIAIFCGYVFGGKGLEVLKAVMEMKKGKTQEPQQ